MAKLRSEDKKDVYQMDRVCVQSTLGRRTVYAEVLSPEGLALIPSDPGTPPHPSRPAVCSRTRTASGAVESSLAVLWETPTLADTLSLVV